jgi:hypothetical protein
MKRLLGIFGIIVGSLLFMGTYGFASLGCGRRDVCSAYKNSDVIVIGTVSRLEIVKDESGADFYELAHVKVLETLKGSPETEVRVFNQLLRYEEEVVSTVDLDDAHLQKGLTYLILGSREGSFSGTQLEGVLYNDPCDEIKNALLNKALITTMREYAKRGMPQQGAYEGHVVFGPRSEGYLPVRGATVQITGESRSVEQIVDRNGGFRFFDLLPGEYKASVIARDGSILHENEPFSISDGATAETLPLACKAMDFETAARGVIDGLINVHDGLSVSTVLQSDYGEFRRDYDIGFEELPPASYKLLVSSVYSDTRVLVYAHRPLLANIDLKTDQQIEDLKYEFTPPRLRGRSMKVSLMSWDDECPDDAKFELVVEYQNGVTTIFEYGLDQELIFEKASSVHLKALCEPKDTGKVFSTNSVTIDSAQPPSKVTLFFGKPKTK